MITALAGGVGAARFLSGLFGVVEPTCVTVVGNTGDDATMHGLHVSPDLDTLVYTLSGCSNPDTGWGLAGETWQVMEALERYGAPAWFRLGDRDLGTHLFRTGMLASGASLSEATARIASAWGLGCRIVPMSDDPVRTKVRLAGGDEVDFQDYFVRLGHAVPVSDIRFDGARSAAPAPGVLRAIDEAETIVVCPSNPLVSIGPIVAVAEIAGRLASRRANTVAVSPIVAGAALKGPADRMMAELGHEPSVVGVARLYADYVSTLVVDVADAHLAPAVESVGLRCVVARTVMDSPAVSEELARTVLTCGS